MGGCHSAVCNCQSEGKSKYLALGNLLNKCITHNGVVTNYWEWWYRNIFVGLGKMLTIKFLVVA